MKQLVISIKYLIFSTLLLGLAYPLLVTGIGQVFFQNQVNGSLVEVSGKVVGSELLSQMHTQEKYFWPRPSGIDFNPMPSGGSNLGPTSSDLAAKVKERRDKGFDNEMLFTSGSGLDPDIYPNSAVAQVERVSKARNLNEVQKEKLLKLIEKYTAGRQFGILGESRVNVLKLNLALDKGEDSE